VAGIPLVLIMVSIIEMALTMWTYETLAFAVREGARYAATKGQGCGYSGNSCGATVANVAQKIAAAAIGLSPGILNVTLTSAAGSITCNPLNSCYSNNTSFPPSSSNAENTLSNPITVTGSYPATVTFTPLMGNVSTFSGTLQAASQQIIQF
jgi:TadE-like protein